MDRAHGESDEEQAVGLGVLSALWGRAPSKDERLIVQEIASLFLDRFGTFEGEIQPVEYQLEVDRDGGGSDDEEG